MSSPCPICNSATTLLDVVDLNKSCEEPRGKFLPLSGSPIYYANCDGCGFTFSPTMYAWPIEEFAKRIYNEEYVEVDPDYVAARPSNNAKMLQAMVPQPPQGFRHLDYGGGDGLLSQLVGDAGWASQSYDPFVDGPLTASNYGSYDLITAFEVFEHVPNVQGLMADLVGLLRSPGVILFTTLLSDGHVRRRERLEWWYASPRNGHISLFSRSSLERLADSRALNVGSFSGGMHAFWHSVPAWAETWLRVGQ